MSPDFLSVDEVLALHAQQRARFGGGEGLRDLGLLESALAQPMASFGGVYAHPDLPSMAAAYLFHIARNHPFVDGNKRVGLLAALVFLDLNGICVLEPTEALRALTMGVAAGRLDKARAEEIVRGLI